MSQSHLEYVATVKRHDSYVLGRAIYADLYIVQLRLVWDNYRGPLCALGFSTDRTVVVDRNGVVRAHGDGGASMVVT